MWILWGMAWAGTSVVATPGPAPGQLIVWKAEGLDCASPPALPVDGRKKDFLEWAIFQDAAVGTRAPSFHRAPTGNGPGPELEIAHMPDAAGGTGQLVRHEADGPTKVDFEVCGLPLPPDPPVRWVSARIPGSGGTGLDGTLVVDVPDGWSDDPEAEQRIRRTDVFHARLDWMAESDVLADGEARAASQLEAMSGTAIVNEARGEHAWVLRWQYSMGGPLREEVVVWKRLPGWGATAVCSLATSADERALLEGAEKACLEATATFP